MASAPARTRVRSLQVCSGIASLFLFVHKKRIVVMFQFLSWIRLLFSELAYGFQPFQRGDDVGSFPSGHACRILGFAAVWMIAMPGSRVITMVLSVPMLLSLVAMNYHFVSDVIAGSVLGALVAVYATHLARLKMA